MNKEQENSSFFKKYFTYYNEYISGTTYFNRLILWIFFYVFFVLLYFTSFDLLRDQIATLEHNQIVT